MNRDRVAFVDESAFRRGDQAVYLLAASLIQPADARIADAVLGLRKGRVGKLHWTKEQPSRRRLIAERISGLGVTHLVVVRRCSSREPGERQRRKCLEGLYTELDTRGISRVIIESRGPADDRRDVQVTQTLRSQKRLSSNLRIAHEPGPVQPLLWVPDVICGAFRSGGALWAALSPCCDVIEIDGR